MIDVDFLYLLAYFLGSLVGFFVASSFTKDSVNRMIDHLVDEGFLRYKQDADGNIIILKWHDSRN